MFVGNERWSHGCFFFVSTSNATVACHHKILFSVAYISYYSYLIIIWIFKDFNQMNMHVVNMTTIFKRPAESFLTSNFPWTIELLKIKLVIHPPASVDCLRVYNEILIGFIVWLPLHYSHYEIICTNNYHFCKAFLSCTLQILNPWNWNFAYWLLLLRAPYWLLLLRAPKDEGTKRWLMTSGSASWIRFLLLCVGSSTYIRTLGAWLPPIGKIFLFADYRIVIIGELSSL